MSEPEVFFLSNVYDKNDANVLNGEKKTFLHKGEQQKITIPMGNTMEDVKQLVLTRYNNVHRANQFNTVNHFYCGSGDVTQEILTIDDLKNCKNIISVYFNDDSITSAGGGAYHNRRRSYSRRRLSAKKRGTRRSKSNRRQRRGTRRSH